MTDGLDNIRAALAVDDDETEPGTDDRQRDPHVVIPVPADAEPPEAFRLRGRQPDRVWDYCDAEGRLTFAVARWDQPGGGKEVRPLVYRAASHGRGGWALGAHPAPRPLYGLDRIARHAGDRVVIVEGEKSADAARAVFPDDVVTTPPGGAGAAGKADWTPLTRFDCALVWGDADEPGARFATSVAGILSRLGIGRVDVVDALAVAATTPTGGERSPQPGWDVADAIADGWNPEALRLAVEANASRFEPTDDGDAPLPLFPPLGEPLPFPMEALGETLAPAALAIARKVQAPPAIAAQSVLAVASLAAQVHADVEMPYGQSRPLSLFLVTVAASGDRKTTTDTEALRPIRAYEERQKAKRAEAMERHRIDSLTWNAERKRIERSTKLDYAARRDALESLGPEPAPPLLPILTAPDPTIEGLIKCWTDAPAGMGLFSAEGGQFVGGHGMSADHRLKTAAALSELWDGKSVHRLRAGDGVTLLEGRRLALHVLIQPDASFLLLADTGLRDQGLLSRLLVAAPASIAGTRFYRRTRPDDEAAINAYSETVLAILDAPWPVEEGRRNELTPRRLPLVPAAVDAWQALHDRVELGMKEGGPFATIREFANKAAEHAARIAGVLEIVADRSAWSIGLASIANAVRLVEWYLTEACRLAGAARTDPRLLRAQRLLDFLQRRDDDRITLRDIVRLGPSGLRTADAANEALDILIAHGWCAPETDRSKSYRIQRKAKA